MGSDRSMQTRLRYSPLAWQCSVICASFTLGQVRAKLSKLAIGPI